MEREFTATPYRWQARTDTWVFVDLPVGLADEIEALAGGVARGFGSLRVEVRLGATTWRTSIFPSSSTYVLPLKQAVRRAEGVELGQDVAVRLRVVDLQRAGRRCGGTPTSAVIGPD